jgi:GDPmannose 4,6-dehydratase
VTRKITRAATRIKEGLQESFSLGNLDAKRDWGYAPEYCEGMWRMLQQDKPDDYVLATGETRTVREFVDLTFKQVNIKLNWEGKGIDEKGIDSASDKVLVQVNPAYFRLTEVDLLIGDPTKAKEILGWQSQTKLEELVKVMVKSDWEKVKRRGY